MYKLKSLFFFVLLIITPAVLYSQSINTNSPYTQYGYGQLPDQSFGSQRAMGGIGYGLRDSKMINPLNPASFSSVDSMTFMLDIGVKAQVAWLEEGSNKAKKYDGSLEYVALQFPLMKRLGMGIGLAPISHVGYKFNTEEKLSISGEKADIQTVGEGGLSKVYGTLSYGFLDRLSLGVNVAYLFGDVIHKKSVYPHVSGSYTTVYADTLRSSGFVFEIGAQYRLPLNKKNEIVIGAVYTPKVKLSSKMMKGELSYDGNEVKSSKWNIYDNLKFHMPETYAGGVSYSKINKFTVGADFQYQRWSDVKFQDLTDLTPVKFSDRMKINLGGEYIPDNMAHNVFKKIRYRAGAYYSSSYVKVKNQYEYNDYGFTLGLGIPMVDRRSFINLAFEYNFVRPEKSPITMVEEEYFRFTFSYTFNELWFFKRKLQ